jgi:hypothetical protein
MPVSNRRNLASGVRKVEFKLSHLKGPRADWQQELAVSFFLWKRTSEVLPSLWMGTLTPLIATHRHSTTIKVKYREAKSTGLRMLSRFSAMNRAPIFCQNTGACASWRISRKNERRTDDKRCDSLGVDEVLAATGKTRSDSATVQSGAGGRTTSSL